MFRYRRAVLCTFQILSDFYYIRYASLVAISGPKKVSIFRAPHPLKMALFMDLPPQNHYVLHHINNRYINS
jgi:hypothetical protein